MKVRPSSAETGLEGLNLQTETRAPIMESWEEEIKFVIPTFLRLATSWQACAFRG